MKSIFFDNENESVYFFSSQVWISSEINKDEYNLDYYNYLQQC